MKVVKIVLSAEAKKTLEDLQHNGSGLMRERSLAILHCSAGKKILWIAHALNRRPLTVRRWIDAYLKNGIEGLARLFSWSAKLSRFTLKTAPGEISRTVSP
jgi:hypothetical protein